VARISQEILISWTKNLFMQLGIDPMKVLLELLIFGLPLQILCVWATTRSRGASGSQATFWLFYLDRSCPDPIFAVNCHEKGAAKN